MSNLTKQRDDWHNFGGTYHRSGTARGTTTSSGVLTVNTGFSRTVVDGFATDEASHFKRADLTVGTTSTFYHFQWLTPDGVTARFRVFQFKIASASSAVFTMASSTSAVTLKWHGFGY